MAQRDHGTTRRELTSPNDTVMPAGFGLSDAELEVAWLILHNPAEHDRRLESYFRLLGEDRPWWRCCMEADHPRWADCVRHAVETIAREQGISPRMAANCLDGDECPRARHRVLEKARKTFYDQGAA